MTSANVTFEELNTLAGELLPERTVLSSVGMDDGLPGTLIDPITGLIKLP